MIKKLIPLTLFLFSSSFSFAQNKTKDFNLEHNPLLKVSSKYSKLTVIDSRPYKESLGIIQLGAFNSKAKLVPKEPIEEQLVNLFEKINQPTSDNYELYFVLEKFLIAEATGSFSESGYFDFKALVFEKRDNNEYALLTSIDTSAVVKGVDVTKKNIENSNSIVSRFLTDALSSKNSSTKKYSYSELLDFKNVSKMQFPFYRNEALLDGIYYSFDELKNQKPLQPVFLKNNNESKGFYAKDGNEKLKKISHKNVYAVVSGGVLYIGGLNNFYASYKENNDYYFVGEVKERAMSASSVTAMSLAFGLMGSLIANSHRTEIKTLKIDSWKGDFVPDDRNKN